MELGDVVDVRVFIMDTNEVAIPSDYKDGINFYCWGYGEFQQHGHAIKASPSNNKDKGTPRMKNENNQTDIYDSLIICNGYGSHGSVLPAVKEFDVNSSKNSASKVGDVAFKDGLLSKFSSGSGHIVKSFSCGSSHTAVVTVNNEIWTWGNGTSGQLGCGSKPANSEPRCITLQNGQQQSEAPNIAKVICGGRQTYILLSNGNIFSFGNNFYAQLGYDFNVKNYKDNQLKPQLVRSLLHRPVKDVACGEKHTMFLFRDGKVAVVGNNTHGQVGDGSRMEVMVPKMQENLTSRVVFIASGLNHNIIIDEEGVLHVWGYGKGCGQRYEDVLFPLRLSSGLTRLVQAAGGQCHSIALTEYGEIVSWGYGTDGQLGHSESITFLPGPKLVQASKFADKISQISCAENYSTALTVTGLLYAWGRDSHVMQVGQSPTKAIFDPVLINSQNAPLQQVECGSWHMAAVQGKPDWRPSDNHSGVNEFTMVEEPIGSMKVAMDVSDSGADTDEMVLALTDTDDDDTDHNVNEDATKHNSLPLIGGMTRLPTKLTLAEFYAPTPEIPPSLSGRLSADIGRLTSRSRGSKRPEYVTSFPCTTLANPPPIRPAPIPAQHNAVQNPSDNLPDIMRPQPDLPAHPQTPNADEVHGPVSNHQAPVQQQHLHSNDDRAPVKSEVKQTSNYRVPVGRKPLHTRDYKAPVKSEQGKINSIHVYRKTEVPKEQSAIVIPCNIALPVDFSEMFDSQTNMESTHLGKNRYGKPANRTGTKVTVNDRIRRSQSMGKLVSNTSNAKTGMTPMSPRTQFTSTSAADQFTLFREKSTLASKNLEFVYFERSNTSLACSDVKTLRSRSSTRERSGPRVSSNAPLLAMKRSKTTLSAPASMTKAEKRRVTNKEVTFREVRIRETISSQTSGSQRGNPPPLPRSRTMVKPEVEGSTGGGLLTARFHNSIPSKGLQQPPPLFDILVNTTCPSVRPIYSSASSWKNKDDRLLNGRKTAQLPSHAAVVSASEDLGELRDPQEATCQEIPSFYIEHGEEEFISACEPTKKPSGGGQGSNRVVHRTPSLPILPNSNPGSFNRQSLKKTT